MSSFNDLVRTDQRRIILEVLLDAPNYAANDTVISLGLEMQGHVISRDVVAGTLDWLEEAGLVTIETLTPSLRVSTLTSRGQDVAEGRAKHTGVKRKRAGA